MIGHNNDHIAIGVLLRLVVFVVEAGCRLLVPVQVCDSHYTRWSVKRMNSVYIIDREIIIIYRIKPAFH
jgi:hypothetical protein